MKLYSPGARRLRFDPVNYGVVSVGMRKAVKGTLTSGEMGTLEGFRIITHKGEETMTNEPMKYWHELVGKAQRGKACKIHRRHLEAILYIHQGLIRPDPNMEKSVEQFTRVIAEHIRRILVNAKIHMEPT